jgi:hypothetical protein
MTDPNRSDAPSLRESPRPRPDEWLKSGEYLPPFMRDFHDQKELFKALQEVVERRNAKPNSYTEGLNWIMAHVYSVDVLLWVLARHGYTLQRSRKRVEFADIGDFMDEATQRHRAASVAVLRGAFESARKDGSSLQTQEPQP